MCAGIENTPLLSEDCQWVQKFPLPLTFIWQRQLVPPLLICFLLHSFQNVGLQQRYSYIFLPYLAIICYTGGIGSFYHCKLTMNHHVCWSEASEAEAGDSENCFSVPAVWVSAPQYRELLGIRQVGLSVWTCCV